MLAITIYLLFTMLAVLWLDVTSYTIPNWLVAGLLVVYPLMVRQSPVAVDWLSGLKAMGIVFVVGYAVFAMRWMGGGDIKLLIACALWVGLAHLLDFVFLVSVLGGAFSLIVWAARKAIPLVAPLKKMPRLLRDGEPIPYGVAIASGFLWMMQAGQIAGFLPNPLLT